MKKFFIAFNLILNFSLALPVQAQTTTNMHTTTSQTINQAKEDFSAATQTLAASPTIEELKLANFIYQNAEPLTDKKFTNSMQALVSQIEHTIDHHPDLQNIINRLKLRDDSYTKKLYYLDKSGIQKSLTLETLIQWFKKIEGKSAAELESYKDMLSGTPAMTLTQAIAALNYYNNTYADPEQGRSTYEFKAGFLTESQTQLPPIAMTLMHSEHTLKTTTVPDHIKQICKFDSVELPWTLIQCEVDFNQLLIHNTAPTCDDITWYLIQIFGIQINGIDVDGLTRAKAIDQALGLKLQLPLPTSEKERLLLGLYLGAKMVKTAPAANQKPMTRFTLATIKPITVNPNKSQTNKYGMEFKQLDGGTYTMGSGTPEGNLSAATSTQDVSYDLKPQTVTVDAFQMQVTHVTQLQYFKVMKTNPSQFTSKEHCKKTYNEALQMCPNNPVENVSWENAVSFAKQLNKENDGYHYRIPREAEWEYAARARSVTAYSYGDSIDLLTDYAWFDRNSTEHTHEVQTKLPNDFDLYDMHGNVWQWVDDWYSGQNSTHAVKGGSWINPSHMLRSAMRHDTYYNGYNSYLVGFRVVRTPMRD